MKALINKILVLLSIIALAAQPVMARGGEGQRGGSRGEARTHDNRGGNAPAVHSRRPQGGQHHAPAQQPRPHAGSRVAPPPRHYPHHHAHHAPARPAPLRPAPRPHHGPIVHHPRPVPVHAHRPVRHIHHSARPFMFDRHRYYHHAGHFYSYRPGVGYSVVTFPVNTFFPVLPFPCTQVVINGASYWEGDGTYFVESSGGYVLVEQPVVQVAAPAVVVPAPTVVVPAPTVVVPAPPVPHGSINISF